MTIPTDEQLYDDDAMADLVADVTDEFVEQVERGEEPDVEDFAQRYPQIGTMLRQMLPALQAMREDTGSRVLTKIPLSDVDQPDIGGELGDFRIIREIGRGGMGIVYEAEQRSLKRRVALKVLPFAAAMDARRLERFQNEATAAARLHHAHIVPVHSVGSERGVYYYAMQMIDGDTLADVIRELRVSRRDDNPDSTPARDSHVLSLLPPTRISPRSSDLLPAESQSRNADVENVDRDSSALSDAVGTDTQACAGLSTDYAATQTPTYMRSAVELGIQAAEALEHAHNFDIVHRDIKPGNLMIDRRGHLWITDFGLARIRTETGVTVSGDFVGTFLYSSPEQVLGHAGAVDCRSDIYSLGATLYELLTLEPVVQGATREKIIHEIANEEPVAPRKHNASIPADLETILLKSLSKDPVQRYQTARALADDLRRFLDNRPILAKRPTLLQHATKWARRHTAIVISSVVVLLVAVVALSISTALIARQQGLTNDAYEKLSEEQQKLSSEQDATRTALEAEEKQRRLAENNLRQAREMLQFFMEIAENDLADNPRLRDLRIRMLQASLDYYQDFIEQSADNPPLQTELADAHMSIARILHGIGSTPGALEALEKALQTQEALVRESPEDAAARQRLFSMYAQLGVFGGRNELMLIHQKSVQNHLELDEAQQTELASMESSQHRGRRSFDSSNDFTAMRREFQSETERLRQRLEELLSESQLLRLQQISLQERGTRSFGAPEIASRLGLTAAQRVEIRSLQKECYDLMRRWHEEGRRKEAWEHLKSMGDRIMAVLTPEQLERWDEMTGDPFKGEIRRWSSHRGHKGRKRGHRSDKD